MINTIDVRHLTVYRYAHPVRFGEHRMMLRPRDSHDLRVLGTSLEIHPAASLRWVHDVFGNSIAVATFADMAHELSVESRVRIAHHLGAGTEVVLDPSAWRYPFAYDTDDLVDLQSCLAVEGPDANGTVAAWARGFLRAATTSDTLELVSKMNLTIQREFTYRRRDEAGTQSAAVTLATRTGSCRDFAMLLMEAARHLGIAARFVSGYLYDDAQVGPVPSFVGTGAAHAWAELFLPGAGWVEFDPTNGLYGGRNLVRVAVARRPSQAMPMSGSFVGATSDLLGMSVTVTVTVEAASVPPPA